MTIKRKFNFCPPNDDWLGMVIQSQSVKKGVAHAKKCDIIFTKGTFDCSVTIQDKNDPSVSYSFDCTAPKLDAMLRFLSEDTYAMDEYNFCMDGHSFLIQENPVGKSTAIVEFDSEDDPYTHPWLGEEIRM